MGNNVVGNNTIHSEGNTSPTDFLNFVRNVVIRFLRERPRNKIQLILICVMVRVDPATGEVTNEEQASFNSKQESVFEPTDMEAVYDVQDGNQNVGSVRDVPEERKRLDVKKGRQTGHHLQQADLSEDPPTSSYQRLSQKGKP